MQFQTVTRAVKINQAETRDRDSDSGVLFSPQNNHRQAFCRDLHEKEVQIKEKAFQKGKTKQNTTKHQTGLRQK